MATRKVRSIEEQIQFYKDKAKELEKKKKIKDGKAKNIKLTKNHEGVSELLSQFDKVAKLYNMNGLQLITQLSRLKRTGLVIKDGNESTE